METTVNAVNQPDANGVYAPQLKASAKAKLANLTQGSKGTVNIVFKGEFKHELLQKGTEVMKTIASDFRKLLKEAKLTFRGLRAAAQAGEVVAEIAINETLKGKPYYAWNGEDTYIAGENIEGEDGMSLHRGSVIKLIVSAKGRQIAAEQDRLEEAKKDFMRTNPNAVAKLLFGSAGISQTDAKPSGSDDEKDGLDDEQV